MNPRIPLVAAAAMAAAMASPTAVTAQGTFEGTITVQANAGPQGPQVMEYSFKGTKMRMDISTQGMSMYSLFDSHTNVTDMVIPMRRMYMESTVDVPPAAVAPEAQADTKVKVEWTGKKETIAGHECEYATITDPEGGTTEACLAKGLGTVMPVQGGMNRRGPGGGAPVWRSHIGNTFPLKVVRDGQEVWVVTKIDKKSLDDSLFQVPDGYHKMRVPGGGPAPLR